MPNYKIVIRDWNAPEDAALVTVVQCPRLPAICIDHDGGRLHVNVDGQSLSYPELIGCQFSVNVVETHDDPYEPSRINLLDIQELR